MTNGPYFAFAYTSHEAGGGVNDSVGIFTCLEEAKRAVEDALPNERILSGHVAVVQDNQFKIIGFYCTPHVQYGYFWYDVALDESAQRRWRRG